MGSENVVDVTDDSFEEEVINSPLPVLVDCWAEWCMPCRMIAPMIEELADEYAGRLKVVKLNTDTGRQTAMKYGIQAIPTVLLFKGGQEVGRIVGANKPKSYFQQKIEEVLA